MENNTKKLKQINILAGVIGGLIFLALLVWIGKDLALHLADHPKLEDSFALMEAKSDQHYYTTAIILDEREGYDVTWQSYVMTYKMLREIGRAYPEDAKLMRRAKRAVRKLKEPYKDGARQALSDYGAGKQYLLYIMDIPASEPGKKPGISYFRLDEEELPDFLDDQGNAEIILLSEAGIKSKMSLLIENGVPGRHGILQEEQAE